MTGRVCSGLVPAHRINLRKMVAVLAFAPSRDFHLNSKAQEYQAFHG